MGETVGKAVATLQLDSDTFSSSEELLAVMASLADAIEDLIVADNGTEVLGVGASATWSFSQSWWSACSTGCDASSVCALLGSALASHLSVYASASILESWSCTDATDGRRRRLTDLGSRRIDGRRLSEAATSLVVATSATVDTSTAYAFDAAAAFEAALLSVASGGVVAGGTALSAVYSPTTTITIELTALVSMSEAAAGNGSASEEALVAANVATAIIDGSIATIASAVLARAVGADRAASNQVAASVAAASISVADHPSPPPLPPSPALPPPPPLRPTGWTDSVSDTTLLALVIGVGVLLLVLVCATLLYLHCQRFRRKRMKVAAMEDLPGKGGEPGGLKRSVSWVEERMAERAATQAKLMEQKSRQEMEELKAENERLRAELDSSARFQMALSKLNAVRNLREAAVEPLPAHTRDAPMPPDPRVAPSSDDTGPADAADAPARAYRAPPPPPTEALRRAAMAVRASQRMGPAQPVSAHRAPPLGPSRENSALERVARIRAAHEERLRVRDETQRRAQMVLGRPEAAGEEEE